MTNLSYSGQNNNFKLPLMSRLAIFLAMFLISFLAVSAMNGVLHTIDMSERSRILLISSLQSILVFILPAIVAACLEFSKPFKILCLTEKPRGINIIAVCVCYILGLYFLNQLIYWNDTLSFPMSMHELETTLRAWEENSREMTNVILGDTSIGGLISGILIIGCLTGVAEEMFFRGGLQRMLCQGMSRHVAVWITAFIFSAMHFQFFGFIPRLLLGAFFGYLYIWSRSLWIPIFAHVLNNSIVVASAWMVSRGFFADNIDMLGVQTSGFPWMAIISGVLLFSFLYIFRNWFKSKPSE